MGLKVNFVWVPADYGVTGKEEADEMAKEAAKRDQTELSINISIAEMKG